MCSPARLGNACVVWLCLPARGFSEHVQGNTPLSHTLLRMPVDPLLHLPMATIPRSTHWRSRARTCHQETSGLFPDAARDFCKVFPIHRNRFTQWRSVRRVPRAVCGPATAVTQRVEMFHDLAQFPQMRPATVIRRSRWRAEGVSWRVTEQAALRAHVHGFGSCWRYLCCQPACRFLCGRRSAALQLGLWPWAKRLCACGHGTEHPLHPCGDDREGHR